MSGKSSAKHKYTCPHCGAGGNQCRNNEQS
jgi:hypothetical protein